MPSVKCKCTWPATVTANTKTVLLFLLFLLSLNVKGGKDKRQAAIHIIHSKFQIYFKSDSSTHYYFNHISYRTVTRTLSNGSNSLPPYFRAKISTVFSLFWATVLRHSVYRRMVG
jgi:hypothetical protein